MIMPSTPPPTTTPSTPPPPAIPLPYQVLGVVIARAGSKGLPNKHARPLLGRRVIDYTFDAAVAARSLTRVVVNSDCPATLMASRERFVQSVHRPPALATDDASVQSVLLHTLEAVEAHSSFRADAVVLLYGNIPVRPDGAIDRCVEHLKNTGCDSVRTFCPVGKWHPEWMNKFARSNGGQLDKVQPLRPGSIHRRQDLEPVFLHDGACVAMSRASLERGRTWPDDPHAMFGTDRRGIRVGEGETVEIDSERDLFLAQAVLTQRGATDLKIRMAG